MAFVARDEFVPVTDRLLLDLAHVGHGVAQAAADGRAVRGLEEILPFGAEGVVDPAASFDFRPDAVDPGSAEDARGEMHPAMLAPPVPHGEGLASCPSEPTAFYQAVVGVSDIGGKAKDEFARESEAHFDPLLSQLWGAKTANGYRGSDKKIDVHSVDHPFGTVRRSRRRDQGHA
jgi:hypothetical protein